MASAVRCAVRAVALPTLRAAATTTPATVGRYCGQRAVCLSSWVTRHYQPTEPVAQRFTLAACPSAQRGLHSSLCSLELRVVGMPQPAESITEGEIGSIEKDVGDYVAVDETVVFVETDKTTVPVNAPVGGTLTQIFVEEGETVVVGAKLFEINSDGSEPAGGDSEAPGAAAEEPSASQAPETADTPDSETPSAASGQRTASVQFPRRRDEHGNPLVPLSLEFFHKGPAGVVEEYSDSFARKPIDEEEIEIINAGGAWD
eukprot:m.176061 g.176061  ORF g.176061 m.176061 type:complete len:259 (-) comp17933_c0_seq3:56-832(-)